MGGLSVIAERPLVTYGATSGTMQLYADIGPQAPMADAAERLGQRLQEHLNAAIHLEKKVLELLEGHEDVPQRKWHSFAHVLASQGTLDRMDNVHSFQKLATQYIRPMLTNLGQKLKEKNSEELMEWYRLYRAEIEGVCGLYTQVLEHRTHVHNRHLKGQINDLCPDLTSSPSLAQKALRAVLNTGVDAVACAMPTPRHFKELVQFHGALWDPVDRLQLRGLLGNGRIKHP
uniref:Uncharacterized protein n=1 Tax=Eutreptiella gymnastica TaxID=73025 RepID=A0A7S1NN51_9EUGL|mmetsp:Transcript_55587/g.99070  ORF Transcript_55587/g.99070 Transcript_55587/m.99070 type:complete len:231 (+) Transcript_55587:818-1510(+)